MGDAEHVFGRGLALLYLGLVISLVTLTPSLGVYRMIILLIGVSLLFWGGMLLLSTRGSPRMDMQLSVTWMSRMLIPCAGFLILASSLLFGILLLLGGGEYGFLGDEVLASTHVWFVFFGVGILLVATWLFQRSGRMKERFTVLVAGLAVMGLLAVLLLRY
jgi:hypothetical protein